MYLFVDLYKSKNTGRAISLFGKYVISPLLSFKPNGWVMSSTGMDRIRMDGTHIRNVFDGSSVPGKTTNVISFHTKGHVITITQRVDISQYTVLFNTIIHE